MAPRDPWDDTRPLAGETPPARRSAATLDRFQGCLVGLAVGGSLGAVLQGLSPPDAAQRWRILTEREGLLPPAVTTGLVLCVAGGVLAQGSFDREAAARRLLEWRRAARPALSLTATLALDALESGATLDEAALAAARQRGDEAADAGALTAAIPLALLNVYDPSALQWDAMLCALITHWDERATWAAIALNLLLAELLNEQREDYLRRAAERLEEAAVRSALLQAPSLSPGQVRAGSFAPRALQAAVWAFHDAASFEDALRRALELGGEATTVGAVTGALAGAYWGLEGIPARWAEALAERDELLRASGGLHLLAHRPG